MSDLDIFDASYDLRDLSPKQKAAVVRLMELAKKEEEQSRQTIIDLIDKSLVKIGLDPNSYTVAGRVDMLLRYAIQSIDRTKCMQCGEEL